MLAAVLMAIGGISYCGWLMYLLLLSYRFSSSGAFPRGIAPYLITCTLVLAVWLGLLVLLGRENRVVAFLLIAVLGLGLFRQLVLWYVFEKLGYPFAFAVTVLCFMLLLIGLWQTRRRKLPVAA